jgi:hypothetical protein
MVDRTEWIERQFTFGLPLGMYGNVVERVRGTPARLEDLTRGLSTEVLTRREGDKVTSGRFRSRPDTCSILESSK